MEFNRVVVLGLGYIGLPTAALLASRGIEVVGVDVNQQVVDTVNQGAIHIIEPDLDILVQGSVHAGKLRATTQPEEADVFLVAVPTPFKEGNKPDLKYIESAAEMMAPVLKAGDLVVLESTSPVGATEQLSGWLAGHRPDLRFPKPGGEAGDVFIAHCPERVLPGNVIRELVENDRVIGGLTPRCSEVASAFYRLFVRGECVTTDSRTAELVKLSENAYRDVNIAFANELSLICEPLGIDPWELVRLANRHPRVNILQPGPGVGGHCIAVDPWFIVSSAPEQARLITEARRVNDGKPHYIVDKIRAAIKDMSSPRVALLGLSYKADIDDLRESPSMDIVLELVRDPVKLMVVEPNISQCPEPLAAFDNLEFHSLESALEKADVLAFLVRHKPFMSIDKALLKDKLVLDYCGLFS